MHPLSIRLSYTTINDWYFPYTMNLFRMKSSNIERGPIWNT